MVNFGLNDLTQLDQLIAKLDHCCADFIGARRQ